MVTAKQRPAFDIAGKAKADMTDTERAKLGFGDMRALFGKPPPASSSQTEAAPKPGRPPGVPNKKRGPTALPAVTAPQPETTPSATGGDEEVFTRPMAEVAMWVVK
jgi:hypothetical protein